MDRYRKYIAETASILLILLFAYTAFSKIIDWNGTKNALYNQVFPIWMAEGLLWGLPVVELAVAGMLLFDKWRLWGFWCSAVLMWFFTGYVALVMTGIFGRIPCSCGGVIGSLGWEEHLLFNLVFLGLAMLGLRVQSSGFRVQG